MGKTKASVRIVVTEGEEVVSDAVFESDSKKRLKERSVARLLARVAPGFKRRQGRLSLSSGMEVLPAVEKSENRWVAWRLRTEDDSPSGYEPPRPDGADDGNPYADRTRGVWQRAEVSEL